MMHNQKIEEYGNQFSDAEAMWFWFIASKRLKSGFLFKGNLESRRPCEVVDIEVLITKLHLSGKISNKQIKVMTKYGFMRKTPNKNLHFERQDFENWTTAMSIIQSAAKTKGWIE